MKFEITGLLQRSARITTWPFIALALLLAASAVTVPLAAQTAQLNGVVTDPQGATIAGASVSVQNEATGIRRETKTTQVGLYEASSLDVGVYSVTVQQAGFQTAVRTGVTLSAHTITRLDIQLSIGSSSTSITVTGDAPVLQPNNAQSETLITGKQYENLALVQQGRIRSPATFVYLSPGVQGNILATGAQSTRVGNDIQVNGAPSQMVEVYLDGLPFGQMRPGNVGSVNQAAPPVDGVQEFKITTTQLPADYGHTGAAVGVFIVKSGTNDLHGSGYEYVRNTVLDAHTWGLKDPTVQRQNEFGATVGGPIWIPRLYDGHNRSFFFFSYGGSRQRGKSTFQRLVIPTPQQLSGDFRAVTSSVYDPATTTLGPTGQYVRSPFPGNTIPRAQMDPVARAIAQYYPAPNTTGTQNWSGYTGDALLDPNVYTAKVNHQITQNHRLSVVLVAANIPRFGVTSDLPDPLIGGYTQTLHPKTARINYDWLIGPNKLNNFVVGLTRHFGNQGAATSKLGYPQIIGLKGINSEVFPTVNFNQGYAQLAANQLNYKAENTYPMRDTFSWTVGAHVVRFGAELQRTQLNDTNPPKTIGSLNFSNTETANPTSLSSTGNAIASFLLGQVDSGSIVGPMEIATRYSAAGFFVQDDYKLTRRITLNLGLRWEFMTIPTEKADKSSSISLTVPNPGAGGIPGALAFAGSGTGRSGQRTFAPRNYSGFGPRLGVAYAASPSLVLRGGYGVYYAYHQLSLYTAGFQPQGDFTSPNSGITPAFVLADGYPQLASMQPTLSPTLLNRQSATYLDSTAGELPRIQQWVVNIQRSLRENWLFQLGYVGNHSARLINPSGVNVNQLDPARLKLGSLLTQSATSSAAQSAGIRLPYTGFTGTVAQALRPFPQYMTLTSAAAKSGGADYHALQAVVKKRFSRGLALEASYSFAKNLGDVTVLSGSIQDAFNPSAERSLLPNDVRHAVVSSWSYELPFGRGRTFLSGSGWKNVLAGGWTLSGIHRYQSGSPLVISTANTLPIFNRALRPDIVSGIDPATHIPVGDFTLGTSSVINKQAFAKLAPFTFGNASPTYSGLSNFMVYQEDLSVVKRFTLGKGERVTWSWYGQFFNAFNRHRFTAIDSVFSNVAFGQPTSVSQPRFVQIGARIQF